MAIIQISRNGGVLLVNKNKIFEYLIGMNNQDGEGVKLLEAIEQAKLELESARCVFNNVQDPKLIEVAIYSEEVAIRRYEYLIRLAREKGIKVSNDYVIDQCARLAE